MYYLYHINGVKWGCSKELPNRLKRQGYTLDDVCEIVEQSDIDIASELEKEWNIRDGYGWNDSQEYRRVSKMASAGGVATGKTTQWKKWQSAGVIVAKQKKIKAVECYEYITGKYINTYESATEASRQLNIARGCICGCLYKRNGTKQTHGYTFQFKH